MAYRRLILVLFFLLLCGAEALAQMGKDGQFKADAFSQSYNNDTASQKDTADVLFSFPEYFGGLSHKRSTRIGTLAGGSIVFIGGMQIYNKDYWKLPLVYGGIGAGIGLGCYYNHQYKLSEEAGTPDECLKNAYIWSFVGAGLFYWGSFMDGVIRYKPDPYPYPGKATLFSILLPGLGQIYNGEIWKLPLYWGGMGVSMALFCDNKRNYIRFRDIYNEACQEGYTGPITADVAKYYRDVYRRYRDYSMLAFCAVYLLQVIDANIFAYMHDFEVEDKFSLNFQPAVIMPDNQYAVSPASSQPAFGLSMGMRF